MDDDSSDGNEAAIGPNCIEVLIRHDLYRGVCRVRSMFFCYVKMDDPSGE